MEEDFDLTCVLCFNFPAESPDGLCRSCTRRFVAEDEQIIPEEANIALRECACLVRAQTGVIYQILRHCEELDKAGLGEVADFLRNRYADVCIWEEEDDQLGGICYAVRSPYSPEAVQDFKKYPAKTQRFDNGRKIRLVIGREKKRLWGTLQTFYSGRLALGPGGPFII